MSTSRPTFTHPEANRAAPTDAERWPGLSATGRAMLQYLRTHPSAPKFRNTSGHRLGRWDQWLARLRRLALRYLPLWSGTSLGTKPLWIWPFVLRHMGRVSAWPRLKNLLRGWQALPTTRRADLQRQLARHIPVQRQNARLLCFTTSGTTGHPIRVPSLPRVAADYLALHERALAHFGIRLRAGQGDVGIVLAGFQQCCFTYVSVNPLKQECGIVKLNLHPAEWRDPLDRAHYLDALRPELISGDPVSLAELALLPMRHQPRALLSTSMCLHDGLRQRLQQRFRCPVLDIYSMNEVGPIGVFIDELDGFLLLQPRLFVEILDPQGRSLPLGGYGEIAVSGGFNPCLPLLRYRTGDQAQLAMTPRGPVLRRFQGRATVRLRTHGGGWINNVDVTQALRGMDLQRFALHQGADGTLTLRICSSAPDQAALQVVLRTTLHALLGPWPLGVEKLTHEDKLRQYTSDYPGQ